MPQLVKRLSMPGGFTSGIWDYRGETRPNGGIIAVRACVWHIPVIRNQPGIGDLATLRRVLLNQGLMVQFGSDNEGNVALYTRFNRLCYHARGANTVTCGVEQMHYSIGEPWSKRQMCAAGWIMQYLEREAGLPLRMADVEPGPNRTAWIKRTGHTSHQQISNMAGYRDRSDPGPGFDYERAFALARHFKRHGHFRGT